MAHWFWFVFNCRGIGFLGWNGRTSKKTSEQSSHTVPPQSMLVSLAVVKTKWQITVDLIKFQALSHWQQRKCCDHCKVTQPKLILDIIFYIGHCWIIWSMYVVTLSLCWEPKPHFLGPIVVGKLLFTSDYCSIPDIRTFRNQPQDRPHNRPHDWSYNQILDQPHFRHLDLPHV